MRKVLGNVIKVIVYMLLTAVLALFYSLKYILCGKSILGRIVILGMYFGLVASFLYLPIVFEIIFAVLLLFDLLLSVSVIRNNSESEGKRENEKNTYEQYNNQKVYKNLFFDGMSFEEAKKEYRKLMKMYHPDNVDGSLEMTQKIAEAYSNYCTACGR